MKTIYKMVYPAPNDKLVSAWIYGRQYRGWTKQYRPGIWTFADIGKLFAYSDLESPQRWLSLDAPTLHQLWEAKCFAWEPIEWVAPFDYLRAWQDFWNGAKGMATDLAPRSACITPALCLVRRVE